MLNSNELLILGLVILLLFGGKKIPELMRGLGRGMGEFQKGIEESKRQLEAAKQHLMEHAENVETVSDAVAKPGSTSRQA